MNEAMIPAFQSVSKSEANCFHQLPASQRTASPANRFLAVVKAPRARLLEMMDYAEKGIRDLHLLQRTAIASGV